MSVYDVRNIGNLEPGEQEAWRAGLVADGVMAAVFPDAAPGDLAGDFWERFVAFPDNEINCVYSEDGRRLAMFWLSNKCGRSAFLNFGFLKAGLPVKDDLGRWVLGLLWYTGYWSLASLTPAYNLPAVAYAERLGGRVICSWPGACHRASSGRFSDAVLIQFVKEGRNNG